MDIKDWLRIINVRMTDRMENENEEKEKQYFDNSILYSDYYVVSFYTISY